MAPSSWRWPAFLASIFYVLAVCLQVASAEPSDLIIEGHWSQVSKYWPIEEADFFIATDKGHHYVEAQLPQGLLHDLEVTLEYYYSYSKTKPVMQMIPCLENIFLEEEEIDNKNKWITNKKIVKQADCVARNELAYNVILHDAGDVFAWRKIEIKQATKEQSTTTTTQATLEQATERSISSSDMTSNNSPNQMASGVQSKDSVKPAPVTIRRSESSQNLPELIKDNVVDSSSRPKKSSDEKDQADTDPAAVKMAPSTDKMPETTTKGPSDTSTKSPPSPAKISNYLSRSSSEDFPIEARPIHRFRRDTSSRGRTPARGYEATCKPSSCNRHLFRMATFSVLVRGLPQLTQEGKRHLSEQGAKFLVNLKNKPLKLKARDETEPLEDVDSCLDLQLYMEPNTQLQLLLQDDSDTNKEPRLLETIKRDLKDSTASRWDQFNRCISDYMPKFTPANANSNKHSLTFILKPVGPQQPGQMAVLLDQKSGSFHRLHPVQSFLPDVQQISHSKALNKYWVLDRDGLEKPNVDLIENSNGKLLQVSQIDPSQSFFDLTSRWMQIKDVEILEQPLVFIYRAERVDWIDRIDFQYQRAGDSADDWLSQLVYEANSGSGGGGSSSSSSSSTNSSSGASAAARPSTPQTPPAEIIPANERQKPQAKLIDVPITVKGTDSSEFRIRVRHHLKKSAASSAASTSSQPQPEPLALGIKSLAFADVCSYGRAYCKNNAPCRPNGAVQAECACETGFSGRFCEQVRPCEVLYDVPDATSVMTSTARRRIDGHSLCKSMNSRCIEQLPVLRCEWDNDQFYQCKKLFKLDAGGDVYSTITGQKIQPSNGKQQQQQHNGAGSSESQKPSSGLTAIDHLDPEQQVLSLKRENEEKSKLVIILSVFLVALLVFAVVLVGSMVSRLRVSSSRLRNTRSELQELSRRQLPSARPAFNSRAQASAPRAYNNSAFDVEL